MGFALTALSCNLCDFAKAPELVADYLHSLYYSQVVIICIVTGISLVLSFVFDVTHIHYVSFLNDFSDDVRDLLEALRNKTV